jgi:hypothetical protein
MSTRPSATASARALAPQLVLMARLGYAAKGVVYVVIGVLAAKAAAGAGGAKTDSKGALRFIGDGPFGTVALVVIAVGLLGYMAWRIIAAVTDAERKGNGPTSLALRVMQAGRGVAYGALAVAALRLLGSRGASSSGNQTRHWTARLLDLPFGRVLVALVGLGVIGYAGYQLYRAFSDKVQKHLDLARAGTQQATWIVRLGRFGIGARAVVFVVMGLFLLRAAREHDSSEAGGIAQSLEALERAPHGALVLGLVAFGLIAYGAYQLGTARYRRMRALG